MIAGALGQHVDALIIVTMVVLGVAINFWQSYRSQQAAERLRASVTPTATVLPRWRLARDAAAERRPWRRLPAVGRRPRAGRCAAAGVARSLRSAIDADRRIAAGRQEASSRRTRIRRKRPGRTRRISCFLGTSVVSGTGTALATGDRAEDDFGDIAVRLGSRAPETEFEHGLRRFSLLILRTTVVLVLFILLMGIAFKHDAFESLLFAVALGVGLTPEFLPMISSVTLTQGALRMARDQVIVKHLPAIQDFGSIDILCSDKTGTLTSGVMRFDRAVDPAGAASPRPLTLASINSRFETGIRSPLDAAILEQAPADVAGLAKVDEIPFDFERRRLSVVVETPAANGRRLLITKGAPEAIIERSTAFEVERSGPAARRGGAAGVSGRARAR